MFGSPVQRGLCEQGTTYSLSTLLHSNVLYYCQVVIAVASLQVAKGTGPAVHGGELTDGGMVEKEGWRNGAMVSCHLTKPNYKTTQHCAHSWGVGWGVGVACCLSPGGRLMMLVWPAEGRPTQTSPHYCQRTSRREHPTPPRHYS